MVSINPDDRMSKETTRGTPMKLCDSLREMHKGMGVPQTIPRVGTVYENASPN
jgi:hypothetical protein